MQIDKGPRESSHPQGSILFELYIRIRLTYYVVGWYIETLRMVFMRDTPETIPSRILDV